VEHVDRDDRRVLVEGLAVGLERTALIGEGRNRESFFTVSRGSAHRGSFRGLVRTAALYALVPSRGPHRSPVLC
jgi:hypothetical protein